MDDVTVRMYPFRVLACRLLVSLALGVAGGIVAGYTDARSLAAFGALLIAGCLINAVLFLFWISWTVGAAGVCFRFRFSQQAHHLAWSEIDSVAVSRRSITLRYGKRAVRADFEKMTPVEAAALVAIVRRNLHDRFEVDWNIAPVARN